MVSFALESAKALLQTWNKGVEQKNAQATKTEINSIFTAAQDAVEAARTDGQNVVNDAGAKMREKSSDAETIGNINKQLVETYTEEMKKVSEQQEIISKKVEERDKKADEIKELGGKVEDLSTPETEVETVVVEESDSGNNDKKANNDTKTTKVQKKTVKAKNHNAKISGENKARIEQLNQEIGEINGQIKETQGEISEIQQNSVIKITEEVTTNIAKIVTDKQEASSIKTNADKELVNINTKLDKTIDIKTKDIAQKISTETQASMKNSMDAMKAVTLKTTLEAEEVAAKASEAAPGIGSVATILNSADDQARKDAIQKLGEMDKDLNNSQGAAKLNNDNVQLGNNNTQAIQNALQQLRTGDFQGYTQTINEVYSNVLQSIDQQLTIQLPGKEAASDSGEVAESDTTDLASSFTSSSSKTDSSSGSNDFTQNITSAVLASLSTIIPGEAGKMIGDMGGLFSKFAT